MMNKRGQIFLIAAIIITLGLVSVTIKYNTAKEYPLLVEYQDLAQNYLNEVPKIINYAKFSNADPKANLDKFSQAYVETAHQKDPKFGVFYAYKGPDGTFHIVNTLNNRVLKIKVTQNGATPEKIIIKNLYGDLRSNSGACINGAGCITRETDTKEFGGQFLNTQDLTHVSSIEICLGGDEIRPTECTDSITETAAITQSERSTSEALTLVGGAKESRYDIGTDTQVYVTVEEY